VYDSDELAEYTDPFFSNAPVGPLYTESLLELEPFHVGPDSAPIGQEFLNAITDVEQGGADPAEAWETALHNIEIAIGE
jgi:cellobiose transport system substrate-binding protein